MKTWRKRHRPWLHRRKEADRRQHTEHGSYIFDLDVREGDDDDDDSDEEDALKFSVDSYAYGNWTRFVKCVELFLQRWFGSACG